MDGATIGVITLLIINIAAVAYSYGSLSQKVNDLCRRVNRLEMLMNGHTAEGGKYDK